MYIKCIGSFYCEEPIQINCTLHTVQHKLNAHRTLKKKIDGSLPEYIMTFCLPVW